MWDLWIKYHTLVLPRVRLKTRITQNRCSTNKHVGSKNDERLVWKQLCARNKVFNRLEALHRKPSLSIVFNTSSKTKKYIWWNKELTLKCKLKCYLNPWITHRALALIKGNREPHEAKKKSFDLGGNRTHDLRIRSTVTLPTELRGRTEKVGDDLGWWIAAKRK